MTLDSQNISFTNFKRYEHEIFLDVHDAIINPNTLVALNTFNELGENEIHHMLSYYQKTILNTLLFKDNAIFYNHQKWLYKVYYHRGIDLDFFLFLNETYQKVYSSYISKEISLSIDKLIDQVIETHNELKESAAKKLFIELPELTQKLTKALLSGNKDETYKIFQANINTLHEFLDFHNNTISQTMKNIGYLWEIGEVSVAKEHLATATLHDIFFDFLEKFPEEKPNSKHIVLSTAPKELHTTAIDIASIVFKKLGYKVTYIEIGTDTKALIKAIKELHIDYIILSATLPSSLIDMVNVVEELKKDVLTQQKALKIGIAGAAFESIKLPRKTFGVNFYMNKLANIDEYVDI